MSQNDRSAAVAIPRAELVADGIVHAMSLAFAVAACIALIAMALPRADAARDVGLAIYAAGLVAMFGCSALYNLAGDSSWKDFFRRLDHAAIFVMIAGTYSPFTLASRVGPPGREMFVFVWGVAALGVTAKLFFPLRFERFFVAIYLLLGWTMVADPGPFFHAIPMTAFLLLAAGGLFYSVGTIFHLWKRLPYQNAIWHAFVLVGAGCQYAAITRFVTAG